MALRARTEYDRYADVADDPVWRQHGEAAKADDRMELVPAPRPLSLPGASAKVLRVTVKKGDTNVTGSGEIGARAEVMTASDIIGGRQGTEYGALVAFMLASDFDSPGGGWNNLLQLHSALPGSQSPWSMNVSADVHQRMRHWGGNPSSPFRVDPDPTVSNPVEKGAWHVFAWGHKLSPNSDGVTEVWQDGTQRYQRVAPNTYFNDDLYFKLGHYRDDRDPSVLDETLWFSDLFIFDTVGDAVRHMGWDGSAPPPPTPPAVEGVKYTARSNGDGTATLSWQPVPGIEAYRLFRDGKPISSTWDPAKTTWRVQEPVAGLVLHGYDQVV